MKKVFFIFIVAGFYLSVSAQTGRSRDIKVEELKKSMYFLASDSLAGRFPGSKGDVVASAYIATLFKEAGLNLYQKNGFQNFDVITRQELGKKSSMRLNGKKLKVHQDFMPFPISANGKVSADIVFAGYGFDIKSDTFQWNDYAGIDVKGKIVLLLRGAPDSSSFPTGNYSDDIVKAINARDKGAVAILFASGSKYDNTEKFPELNLKESSAGIPVFQIRRSVADAILKMNTGKSINALEEQYNRTMKPAISAINAKADLVSEILKIKVQTNNVIGFLYASDTTKVKTYVVVGAHYDHLGMGGPGSSSRMQDTVAIHNGADDNASGVTALLELVGKLGGDRTKLKQNIIFVSFGAEEMGILGSKYFTEHSPVPLKSIKAMVNLDMVGRLKADTMLQVNGTGTSKEAVYIVNDLNKQYHFNLRMSPEGYGPSDHAAFYAKNIPVFFLTTGAHTDYHTPMDDREKINYQGLEMVTKFSYDLITQLASDENLLTFQEAGPQQAASGGRRYKITLGIMPDINNSTDKGLLVEFVTKGKPAYNGGMLKGDIITSVDGKPVRNIQDYMVRLSQLKAGQSVHVEVLRNNKTELLIIQL